MVREDTITVVPAGATRGLLSVAAQVLTLMRDLRAQPDVGDLFISHDLATVSAVGDRVVVRDFSTRILRGVVSLPHGYRDCNVGDLTSDRDHVDPLTGMVLQSGVTVRLVAVGSGTERPARV